MMGLTSAGPTWGRATGPEFLGPNVPESNKGSVNLSTQRQNRYFVDGRQLLPYGIKGCPSLGFPPLRTILCGIRRISDVPAQPRMIRCIFVCYLSLICLCLGMFGQVAEGQQPSAAAPVPALDSEYRKFDDVLSFLRTRIARQYAIDSARGVDEAMYVHLGAIEQWVTIRGEDRHNPVLRFVHGGPGDVTNPWSFAYFAAWEKRFTVVQWDERGAGRTLRKTVPRLRPP
jgi:hypothetical protein